MPCRRLRHPWKSIIVHFCPLNMTLQTGGDKIHPAYWQPEDFFVPQGEIWGGGFRKHKCTKLNNTAKNSTYLLSCRELDEKNNAALLSVWSCCQRSASLAWWLWRGKRLACPVQRLKKKKKKVWHLLNFVINTLHLVCLICTNKKKKNPQKTPCSLSKRSPEHNFQ